MLRDRTSLDQLTHAFGPVVTAAGAASAADLDDDSVQTILALQSREFSSAQLGALERHASEIFATLGLDLDTPGTRDTPRRFIRALIDATAGYDGDPKLLTSFPTEWAASARPKRRDTKGDRLNALVKTCSRRALSVTTAGLLGLAAVAPAYAVTPTAWQMNVGAEADRQGIQVNSFLPRSESIDVGDTVKWTVKTGELHTITFLSGGAQPPVILPGPPPSINPAAAAPAGGSSYAGTGYFNSGLLVKDQTYSLTFTAPGDFAFLCLVHGDMAGTVHAAKAGTAYPHTQGFYDRQGSRAADHLVQASRDLREGALEVAAEEPNLLVAGTGTLLTGIGSLAVLRFLPERQVVKVGATVNWTNIDPETPHTITFGPDPGSVDPFGAFPPSGIDRPGHATISATNQAVNSGFIGAALPFGAEFSATFTQPGVYTYICSLHDTLGMKGVIQVVASDPNDDKN